MRPLGFMLLFVVLGATLVFIMAFHAMVFPGFEDSATLLIPHNRKLRENFGTREEEDWDNEKLNLEDYHDNDPVPISKATIRHKPIAHGSPLMPYIPKLAPPAAPPTSDGLPSLPSDHY